MESEYDRKFEEMKKYVPFLDDMIKRLESSGLSSNPRQAQLDKLRWLRGLLLEKKKRLKMENLIKCEQVLINLHAKVEQRDLNSTMETENTSLENDKTHLKAVRNKLKSVVSKLNVQDHTGTLPEIARASKVEEICVQGSKEPALFQRRPNKGISAGSCNQAVSFVTETEQSKKNYTRVLHSPVADDSRCWSTSEKESDNVLFSRRSPRRDIPSYNKKERKKSKQIDKYGETKGLNITLNLSKESLSSLSTNDILSRIINCRDDDVDINTLRELRSQILRELKNTASKDDASDINLKSYKKGNKNKKNDMEDGELTDSETEVIQTLYNSLVVMDKDKNTMNLVSKTSNDEAPRKIKICLVINNERVKPNISKENKELNNHINIDITDFQNYHNENKNNDCMENKNSNVLNEQISDPKNNDENVCTKLNLAEKSTFDKVNTVFEHTTNTNETKVKTTLNTQSNEITKHEINDSNELLSTVESIKDNVICTTNPSCLLDTNTKSVETNNQTKRSNKKVKIPLLNLEENVNKEVASEIDILQALKKEIFSETSTVLSTDAETPPLHQPKISKVINSHEIGNKKRISIEKYKAKSTITVPSTSSLKVDSVGKDDLCKKQSLKLTEKECERFNFLSKISIDDSSDEEDKSSLSFNDIHEKLAPKSPDHDDFADTGLRPPIIIPSDPVDKAITTTESDIDMRKSLPVPNTEGIISNLLVSPIRIDPSIGHINADKESYNDTNKEQNISLADPRIKRDVNIDMNVDTSNPITTNTDVMSRQMSSYGDSSIPQSNIAPFLQSIGAPVMVQNINPALVSNVSPSVSIIAQGIPLSMANLAPPMSCMGKMTHIISTHTANARTYEMTPCRSMENGDFTQNHIYTPLFTSFDEHETENSIEKQRHECNKKEKNNPYEDIGRSPGNYHPEYNNTINTTDIYHPEWDKTRKNIDKRIPVWENDVKNMENYHPVRNDPRKNIDKRIPVWEDSRIMNNFVTRDTSYRGNNDSYQQNYEDRYTYDNRESYNRPECPQTAIHSFGRLDCPPTPTPSFGRSDLPMAPVHSFDRSNLQRSTSQCGVHSDPRRFRDLDYNNRDDDKERRYFNDKNFDITHSYRSTHNNRSMNKLDGSMQYRREQSMGRYDRKSQYRDSSVGSPYDKDYECDKNNYNKHREKKSDHQHEKNLKNNSDYYRREYRNNEVEKLNIVHLSLNKKRPITLSASDRSDNKYSEPFKFDESTRKTLKNHDAEERKNNNFDTRRLRAASVGRTLVRDNITHNIESRFELDKKIITKSIECKRDSFRRAASVGRELANVTKDFRDVKEDLKSFKIISDSKSGYKVSQYKERRKAAEVASSRDLLIKKHDTESRKPSSSCYSSKGNKRDPRLRDDKWRDGNTRKDGRKSRWSETQRYGIVYSSDNISKGKILGSGYGVKNYKIPKIKRTSIDTEISEATEKAKDSTSNDDTISTNLVKVSLDDSNKNIINVEKSIHRTSKMTPCKVEAQNTMVPLKNKNIADVEEIFSISDSSESSSKKESFKYELSEDSKDNFVKRVTRSAKKLLKNEDKSSIETFRKTRKMRKIYISDSDSDDNNTVTEKGCKPELVIDNVSIEIKSNDNEENVPQETKNESEKDKTKKLDVQDTESKDFDYRTNNTYFGRQKNSDFAADDELESFNENVMSDPVIHNINELIADLDQDLDASKSITSKVCENIKCFVKPDNDTEISEMVFISSPPNNDLQNTKSEVDESFSTELEPSSKTFSNIQKSESVPILAIEKIEDKSAQIISKINKDNYEQNDIIKDSQVSTANNAIESCNEKSMQNDAVVPNIGETANAEFEHSVSVLQAKTENTNKGSSDINNIEILPKKAVESLFDNNITKASTGDSTIDIRENQESPKTEVSKETDSIHKLLSLLQNKSKMMELISKLSSDSVENEKIKKKLEKLSEIVSDDEDDTHQDGGIAILDSKGSATKQNEDEKTEDKLIIQNTESVVKESNTLPVKETDKLTNITGDSDHLPKPVLFLDNNYVETKEITKKEEIVNKIDNLNETESQNYENEKPSQNSVQLELDKDTLDISIDTKINQLNLDNINLQQVDDSLNSQSEKDSNSVNNENPKRKKIIKKRRGKNPKIPVNTQKKNTLINMQPKFKQTSSRELKNLLHNLEEYFKDDDRHSSGIRSCRLSKIKHEEVNEKDDSQIKDNAFILLQKCNNDTVENMRNEHTKKKVFKEKEKLIDSSCNVALESKIYKQKLSIRPGPKSKTRSSLQDSDLDPYVFETDSINESNASESKNESDSESENELQIANAQNSDQLVSEDTTEKKIISIDGGVQPGIINPKNRGKRTVSSDAQGSSDNVKIPDSKCFTDKSYCFKPNTSTYSCRLCNYIGSDIVQHYIKHHPHSEIPLSRLSPGAAKKAIKQCELVNFQAISKMPTDKYTCRFCNKDFVKKELEDFFWHVVSIHTGEYAPQNSELHQCSECSVIAKCPFSIDIPPPPAHVKGQLLGYICGKCNFTQVSVENLKTHVIKRHNDEETEVYTISLSLLSKKAILNYLKELETQNSTLQTDEPRKLRNTQSKQNVTECSNDDIRTNEKSKSPPESVMNIQSKLTFERDNLAEISYSKLITTAQEIRKDTYDSNVLNKDDEINNPEKMQIESVQEPLSDIISYPHFKIQYTTNGLKEYVCCINGHDNHYKTTLFISMKRHVQLKHSENWDGYCFLCKAIVTSQGIHQFKDCLHHYFDKHIDDFPIANNVVADKNLEHDQVIEATKETGCIDGPVKTGNVKPLFQMISTHNESLKVDESDLEMPIIESVKSLRTTDQSLPSPSYPNSRTPEAAVEYKYEEAQADIMSKKHCVVLDIMMSHVNLVQIFKCAGKFCSFTTDSAEEALLHSSTHVRIGGENALCCVYCNYDASGNAIDLVTHVFKNHGCCPYVCGVCFYRSAASQLVQAHINRVHPSISAPVLHTTVVKGTTEEENCLPRKIAVPFFVCKGDPDTQNPCKFRTYTPSKFYEHMKQRHQNSKEFLCFICSETSASPSHLIRHLKTHGLKLYQCTWCVYGADSETELLEHSSAKHPCKQPKAFLRIIIKKQGSKEFKVLPLARLNKNDVTVLDIQPNVNSKNPVREAERAIELEKLIGETTFSSIVSNTGTTAYITKETKKPTELAPQLSLLIQAPALQTSSPTLTETPPNKRLSPELAIESPVINLESNWPGQFDIPDAVCLDSDDENFIDISEESSSSTVLMSVNETINMESLYKCGKCKIICETPQKLTLHVVVCSGPNRIVPCAHCDVEIYQSQIVKHYKVHSKSYPFYGFICPICNLRFASVALAEEHFKTLHSDIQSQLIWTGQQFSEHAISKSSFRTNKKNITKRKRSLESKNKIIEPPEKLKKYGPQDIDKLPINPILDAFVHCSLCDFSTKVRLNMVRHLQFHGQQQPVPETAPINPVPHLENNEKHFDKMLNLASSSIVNRTLDKTNKSDQSPSVMHRVAPEDAGRYPKYVPDRQRHTCGAKGCSYISVDENMLKCHWETLHSDTNDYHCVHCPPFQQLDTSKPLNALRIIGHLKMHDVNLYACSICPYYHYMRHILEKHLHEVHKSAQVLVVREENSSPLASTSQTVAAPTMDLKTWHCGLCKFKSLLRPEVVEHCAKLHNSKMQFKCGYCAFRTSNFENIPKHQSKSHEGKQEDIFYYYYREGSVPDDPDGTPCWMKQMQKMDASCAKIKSESIDPSYPPQPIVLPEPVPVVDLNLIKKEIIEPEDQEDDLCLEYGAFCEPNGLKYKCPLCNNVTEDDEESMQSHLYEELKYRKWGCSVCSYKAFHYVGFREHMQTEHAQQQNREPLELPVDSRVETWVTKLLEYQKLFIEKNKENLAKQKAEIKRVNQSLVSESPKTIDTPVQSSPVHKQKFEKEADSIFGTFGEPSGELYCCPKCLLTFNEANDMQTHLESELNKIRWFCSSCPETFQNYHEAQFHCKSVHPGYISRPIEVARDASLLQMRSTWVESVLQRQTDEIIKVRNSASNMLEDTASDQNENSLLVVRFEQQVTTPEEEMASRSLVPKASDDEQSQDKLTTKYGPLKRCPYCSYVKAQEKILNNHILQHYNLKAYSCPYCGLDGNRKQVVKHQRICHPTMSAHIVDTAIPRETPEKYLEKKNEDCDKICLICRKTFSRVEAGTHHHSNFTPDFGKNGDIVVKCCVCSMLYKDLHVHAIHHNVCHPMEECSYVFCKLITDAEGNCTVNVTSLEVDEHSSDSPPIDDDGPSTSQNEDEGQNSGVKRKASDDVLPPRKKVAKKSTSKQP